MQIACGLKLGKRRAIMKEENFALSCIQEENSDIIRMNQPRRISTLLDTFIYPVLFLIFTIALLRLIPDIGIKLVAILYLFVATARTHKFIWLRTFSLFSWKVFFEFFTRVICVKVQRSDFVKLERMQFIWTNSRLTYRYNYDWSSFSQPIFQMLIRLIFPLHILYY